MNATKIGIIDRSYYAILDGYCHCKKKTTAMKHAGEVLSRYCKREGEYILESIKCGEDPCYDAPFDVDGFHQQFFRIEEIREGLWYFETLYFKEASC